MRFFIEFLMAYIDSYSETVSQKTYAIFIQIGEYYNLLYYNLLPLHIHVQAQGAKDRQHRQAFRAWFILQHYRGYRPFINVMENKAINKEIKIKGQL